MIKWGERRKEASSQHNQGTTCLLLSDNTQSDCPQSHHTTFSHQPMLRDQTTGKLSASTGWCTRSRMVPGGPYHQQWLRHVHLMYKTTHYCSLGSAPAQILAKPAHAKAWWTLGAAALGQSESIPKAEWGARNSRKVIVEPRSVQCCVPPPVFLSGSFLRIY